MMELENSSVMTISGEASVSSSGQLRPPALPPPPPVVKKKRNLPGTPDPEAEVIALSPKTLLATNRFVCEICNKGFQRDQNLQLHRRGHNLPWKLRQRTGNEPRKRVYVCPEPGCVHHDPSRALGDLTGIKKHFCRKHGEKKWKCEKCSKKYAVQSDWKAHAKVCGTREYRCDCGTLFCRRDSFITHRAFCDALAEGSVKTAEPPPPPNTTTTENPPSEEDRKTTAVVPEATAPPAATPTAISVVPSPPPQEQREPDKTTGLLQYMPPPSTSISNTNGGTTSSSSSSGGGGSSSNAGLFASLFASPTAAPTTTTPLSDLMGTVGGADRPLMEPPSLCLGTNMGPASLFSPSAQAHDRRPFAPPPPPPSPHMSATALLQKAAQMGATAPGLSFLKGFGLAGSNEQKQSVHDSNLQWGHHHHRWQSEPSAGLRLGLPYEPDLMMGPSSLFGAKPATVDFLGLGMGSVRSSNAGGLSALMTSIGSGGSESAAAAGGGWEGAERKPTSPAFL
ncbi:hypothetical protein Cni_G25724 [Canna indica]|uniref:Protein EARLY HEADING DATE 2 n=1 Tax=Canna indica TaxID=4628 RepID=A0AAQ3QPN6_9LILI|nr:hypothetical protein Cni_G25724 [Canna indica]